jgi:hypothetical protein
VGELIGERGDREEGGRRRAETKGIFFLTLMKTVCSNKTLSLLNDNVGPRKNSTWTKLKTEIRTIKKNLCTFEPLKS